MWSSKYKLESCKRTLRFHYLLILVYGKIIFLGLLAWSNGLGRISTLHPLCVWLRNEVRRWEKRRMWILGGSIKPFIALNFKKFSLISYTARFMMVLSCWYFFLIIAAESTALFLALVIEVIQDKTNEHRALLLSQSSHFFSFNLWYSGRWKILPYASTTNLISFLWCMTPRASLTPNPKVQHSKFS